MIRIVLAGTRPCCAARSLPAGDGGRHRVVATAADARRPGATCKRTKHDLLVTDIEMPGLTGLELAQRIQRHALSTK